MYIYINTYTELNDVSKGILYCWNWFMFTFLTVQLRLRKYPRPLKMSQGKNWSMLFYGKWYWKSRQACAHFITCMNSVLHNVIFKIIVLQVVKIYTYGSKRGLLYHDLTRYKSLFDCVLNIEARQRKVL